MIRVESLSKSFSSGIFKKKWVQAVRGVSFSIAAGETLGLVGESGCGKSTLAKAILRLIEPTAGRIWFENIDLMSLRPKQLRQMRAKMQIIFQHPESALNCRLRIYQSIVEPMRMRGLAMEGTCERQEVDRLIDLVGLNKEHLVRYPHEISGGQIQRAVLARVLSLKPRFLVADEPTSMLDVSVQAQILTLLKEIQARFQIAYLFISHDLDVVRWMSDRVAVMYGGSIVELGPAQEVMSNPAHPYTRQLLAAFAHASAAQEQDRKLVACSTLDDADGQCCYYHHCPQPVQACREMPGRIQIGEGHIVACHHTDA